MLFEQEFETISDVFMSCGKNVTRKAVLDGGAQPVCSENNSEHVITNEQVITKHVARQTFGFGNDEPTRCNEPTVIPTHISSSKLD